MPAFSLKKKKKIPDKDAVQFSGLAWQDCFATIMVDEATRFQYDLSFIIHHSSFIIHHS